MDELHLTLTVDETNQILQALGQLPYGSVYQLVAKIQQQAQQQLNAPTGTAPLHVPPPADDGADDG